MKKTMRRSVALATSTIVVGALAVAGCTASASVDVSGILAGMSGASCTNTAPASGADAGGCNAGFLCFNTYCVQEGALRISLHFAVDSDFDLHVLASSGEEIWWNHRDAASGKLDVDQCVFPCSGPSHVENVFFTDAAAQGTYTFFVENYSARSAGDFTIDVAANGQTTQFHGSLPKESKARSETFSYTYPPPAAAIDGGTDASPDAR